MASGADLFYLMKDGLETPERVIDPSGIASLRALKIGGKGGLEIGAMVRLKDLDESPLVPRILKDTVAHLASPQLRNTSTVAGNLCQRPRCPYFRKKEIVCLKKGGSTCWAVWPERCP
jgi:xanthine dehydrogenase YagS FAD-binding subunit